MSQNRKDVYEQVGVAMTCRSFEEYVRMFALEPGLLQAGPILDVAGGAASFSTEARSRGYEVVAVDPLYDLDPHAMEAKGLAEQAEVAVKMEQLAHKFDWSYYGSPEGHRMMREHAFSAFIDDYRKDRASGSSAYRSGLLPKLPVEAGRFQLVLCSHFLFLYAAQFGYEFHRDALMAMLQACRPGGEVRVYPLQDLSWKPFPDLERLIEELGDTGAQVEFLETRLPFIPGSVRLLRLIRTSDFGL